MSDRFGLLFPGQGSQYVGMGLDLYEKFPEAKNIYDRAEEILELPIRRFSFEGPEEELRQTRYTQPAILVHSLAVLACSKLTAPGSRLPALAAGHSLGEYAALYAAGALDFDSVLLLVKRRAELMWTEGGKQPGTMAAIIGLDAQAVESLCQEVSGVVVPANYNEPKQTVVSGEVGAVQQVAELAKNKGALKAILLPVSGAFHSPLLKEPATEFSDYLGRFVIRDPVFPVIANVTGRPQTTKDEIRVNLSRQLISPVRWVETMVTAQAMGITKFFEIGPGQVLTGLARRINRELVVTPLGRAAEIQALFEKGAV